MKYFLLILSIINLFVLSACANQTPPRFHWGKYPNSLYKYYKNPEKRPQYLEAVEKAVDKGRQENRLAPGLLAELGYLKLEENKIDEVIDLFNEEMQIFPESRFYLSNIIKRINTKNQKKKPNHQAIKENS